MSENTNHRLVLSFKKLFVGTNVIILYRLFQDRPKDLKTDLKNLTIEEKIIECIRMNARVSIPELSKKIEKGITSTKEYLQKMKEKKILQHAGPTNGGHWEILNNK